MLKLLLKINLIAVSFYSVALAEVSQVIELSGAVPAQSVQVIDQVFEPVMGQEAFLGTCERTVYSHSEQRCSTSYQTVCTGGGGQVCHTVNDRVCNSRGCTNVPRRVCQNTPRACSQVPRTTCTSHPVYRNEQYSCTQYRTVVVGQRLVRTFQHEIDVMLEDRRVLNYGAIRLQIHSNKEQLVPTLLGVYDQSTLNYHVQTVSQSNLGSLIIQKSRIVITKGFESHQVRAFEYASIQNLAMNSRTVSFRIVGGASLIYSLQTRIRLTRNQAIGANRVVYDQMVISPALQLIPRGNDLVGTISLQALGLTDLEQKRYDLDLEIKLNGVENVLNRTSFGTTLSKSLRGHLERERLVY